MIIQIGNMPTLEKPAPERDEFYSPHLPVQISKLVAKSKSIELSGVKSFPLTGVECYEIKVLTKGRTYLLYINTETFLLEYWNGREDEDQSILSRLYDYKRIDGLLIPMSDCLMKNGIVYFSSKTRKYLINPNIDPAIFNYKGG